MTMPAPVIWTAAECAAAVDGRVLGPDWRASGIATDPHAVRPGDLFVATGRMATGGTPARTAFEAGAAAALVTTGETASLPAGAPLVVVDDVALALRDLGRFARLRSTARIAAVTGGTGAAFGRDALAALLRPGAVPIGAVHIGTGGETGLGGLTLDLARLPATAGLGVFFLPLGGSSRTEDRSRLVQPDVAVVTDAARAAGPYASPGASPEAVANELAGVFMGMTASGAAVLNRDDPHYFHLLAAARTAGLSRIFSFGDHEDADARVLLCSVHGTGSTVVATVRGERIQYRLPVPGRRHATSSLAALLAAHVLGADLTTAADALADLAAPPAPATAPAPGTLPGTPPGAAPASRMQAAVAAAPKS